MFVGVIVLVGVFEGVTVFVGAMIGPLVAAPFLDIIGTQGFAWSIISLHALVQLAYAIGVEQPMSVYVDSDGNNSELTSWITTNVDLTPRGIINRFDLFRPIYSSTTNYGHFGKDGLPWEELDLFKE